MSYNTIAAAAKDGDLQQRLMAAAAQEGHPDPQGVVMRHAWTIAADPSVAGPYEYAVGEKKTTPGKWEEIVSDAAILAVVQPLVIADLADPEPTP